MPVRQNASISINDKAGNVTAVAMASSQIAVDAWEDDPAAAGAIHDWFVAVEGVSIGNVVRSGVNVDSFAVSPALPTDDQAYRSSKLRVNYHDTTSGVKYNYSIPCRDTTAYNTYPGSKNVILTVAAGGTAAIEALVTATNGMKSPTGGNVAVDSIVVAGGKQ